jgi:hypothetical protein
VPLSTIRKCRWSNTFILLRNRRANQAIARKIIVKTGKSQGGLIEILEGLRW